MIQRRGIGIQIIDEGIIDHFVPSYRLAGGLDEAARRIAQRSRTVEDRRYEAVCRMFDQKLRSVDLDAVMFVIIASRFGKILLTLNRNGQLTLLHLFIGIMMNL